MKPEKRAVSAVKTKSVGVRATPSISEGSASSNTGSPSTSTRIFNLSDSRERILFRVDVILEAAGDVALQVGEHDAEAVERLMSAINGARDVLRAETLTEESKANAGQRTTHIVELATESEGFDQTVRCAGCGAKEGARHLSSCGDHDHRNAVAGVRS